MRPHELAQSGPSSARIRALRDLAVRLRQNSDESSSLFHFMIETAPIWTSGTPWPREDGTKLIESIACSLTGLEHKVDALDITSYYAPNGVAWLQVLTGLPADHGMLIRFQKMVQEAFEELRLISTDLDVRLPGQGTIPDWLAWLYNFANLPGSPLIVRKGKAEAFRAEGAQVRWRFAEQVEVPPSNFPSNAPTSKRGELIESLLVVGLAANVWRASAFAIDDFLDRVMSDAQRVPLSAQTRVALPTSISQIVDAPLRHRAEKAWKAAHALRRAISDWGQWLESARADYQREKRFDAQRGDEICRTGATAIRALCAIGLRHAAFQEGLLGGPLEQWPDGPSDGFDSNYYVAPQGAEVNAINTQLFVMQSLTAPAAIEIIELLQTSPQECFAADVDVGLPEGEVQKSRRKSASRPKWDSKTGILSLGIKEAKRIKNRTQAKNQVAILSAFQKEKWTSRIDCPVDFGGDFQKFHDTLRSLNRGLQGMHFRGDGSGGKGIIWEARP